MENSEYIINQELVKAYEVLFGMELKSRRALAAGAFRKTLSLIRDCRKNIVCLVAPYGFSDNHQENKETIKRILNKNKKYLKGFGESNFSPIYYLAKLGLSETIRLKEQEKLFCPKVRVHPLLSDKTPETTFYYRYKRR